MLSFFLQRANMHRHAYIHMYVHIYTVMILTYTKFIKLSGVE
jgi:hypothetical protein